MNAAIRKPYQVKLYSTRIWTLIAIIVVAPLLSGCGDRFGWYVVSPSLPAGQANLAFMFAGFKFTLLLSLLAMVVSVGVGLLVALPSFSKNKLLVGFNRVYVEFTRAIPPLVLILWVYYGLPIAMDIRISAFWAGVLAVGLSDSPFVAEVFRAGIQSVPVGQSEAAKSMGLTKSQAFRLVVFPQAIRVILPALANQFVLVVKVSSLVSVIGVNEFTKQANHVVTAEYRPLEIYTVLIFEYLLFVLVISMAARWFERRMSRGQERN